MQTLLKRNPAGLGGARRDADRAGQSIDEENSPETSPVQHIPGGAIGALKFARRCLIDATFRLDDAGLTCPALHRLTDDAGHLVSRWEGRPGRVDPDHVPEWIAKAAAEWRRQQPRSGRRS